ncbi:HYR domain-containing protein [Marivirga arenosa]|uniref:HYR domain-containing protein n=1 Tax=Marivirga arenosa TaxID=3059076 RepID=A0AA49GFN7_9BACT|nr:HYR domain-containing protein [Marivirga sp. BKB1-2]WKK83315.2 HYR domain-containing protein [Marivirga sp. BKB1-2]
MSLKSGELFTNCPSNISESVSSACGKIVNWTPPSLENTSLTLESTHSPGDFFPLGSTTVTYNGVNGSGDIIETCSFIITINLSDPASYIFPDVQCTGNITINLLNSCNRSVPWNEPVSPCPEITFTKTAVPGQQFPIGTTEVFYRANLNGLEVASCSFFVTLIDDIDPIIETIPNDITISANENCEAIVEWDTPQASDNCGFTPTLSSNLNSGSTFQLGTTTVTYTATDEGGNTAQRSFNVTVEDNSPPTFNNLPTEIRVVAEGNCTAIATWPGVTASDNCDSNVDISSNINSGTSFILGTTAINYTAIDDAGNVANASFNVVVEDNTSPTVLSCPGDITVSADGDCSAVARWSLPTFDDNCDNDLSITSNHNPGEAFLLGSTTVTYTAEDDAGNSIDCSFQVTVIDDTAPSIEPLNDITVSTSGDGCQAIVSWDPIIISDNCSSSITADTSPSSGDIFSLGETVVTVTATDEAGNQSTSNFSVFVEDNTAGVVSNCPQDIVISSNANCTAAATWSSPVFTDNCDANLTISSSHQSGDVFPLGTTLVTYSATDKAGNSISCSFNVIVEDRSAPVFAACVNDIVITANQNCGAIVEWTEPTLSDNCSTEFTIGSNYNSGDLFLVGTTEVIYSATDQAGNTSSCSFNVIVEDNSNPTVAFCPANRVININENCNGIANWETPIFNDCTNLTISSNFNVGDVLPLGTNLIEYTATDVNGATALCSFTVEVVDQNPPVIEDCPEDIVISAASTCDATVEWTEPTASDNCSSITFESNYEPGATFPLGVTTVEYTFTDTNGNSSICSFSINVIDDSELIIENCPEDIIIQADNDQGTANVEWTEPFIQASECSEISIESNFKPGDLFELGTTDVVYSFVREDSEPIYCSFSVTVEPAELQIEISQIISPNGDNQNDTWIIEGIEKFPDNQVVIVDRWGTEIYSVRGYNNHETVWDGRNRNGDLVARGTYYFFITVRNNENVLNEKGFIEILR